MAEDASDTETIADTPVWGFNPHGHCGDFARLVPSSPLARLAFSRLVQKLHDDPQAAPHSRRFIHYEASIGPGSDTESSDVSSTGGGGGSARGDIRWVGYWRLNLDIPPAHQPLRWVVGSSRKGKTARDDDVDILLTPEPGAHGIAGRHFRLTLNPETAVLLVAADTHSVTINATIKLKSTQQALVSDSGITVRDLAYKLQLTDLDRHAHMARGGYDIYASQAGGTFGTVSYGVNLSTGGSVAVKRVRRTAKTLSIVENEIRILQRLRHPNICSLENVHYPSGIRSPQSFKPGECDDVFLFIRPVADSTLFNYIGAILDATQLKPILQQSLSALSYLHAESIMHRDIKPGNIAIILHPSPRICVIDMGSSLFGTKSRDHMAGTIRYLAPEIIELKLGRSTKYYTMAADVWSLDISLIEVFFRSGITWDRVHQAAYAKFVDNVKRIQQHAPVMEETMAGVLLDMISWDPEKRPTAVEAELRIAKMDTTRGHNEAPEPKRQPPPAFDRQIRLP
ncbi:hypothetical protein GTA08_BOTSDO09243 [Neofusicoccum parvum]|uniref:Uncharacterized protein n=1 Tax=Neofusicoccum parvum TaxID=310453 RepID=A0ACB5SDL0_9PEZI|nr:hypothetical protein GTA08_BOTSDO09243 [Neofusicoccum parvum]